MEYHGDEDELYQEQRELEELREYESIPEEWS